MSAISKLQSVLGKILNRKNNRDIGVSLSYDLDNVVMTQQLPIGASIDASKASERLKEARALSDKNAPDEDIGILLDDAVRLIRKAIAESVGSGRGSSPPDSN